MCRSVSENRRSAQGFSAEWLNDSGRVVHPAAPEGDGGPGAFRAPGVFASAGGSELLPHPRSPAAKSLDPSRVRQADEIEVAKVARQPPPKVAADSIEVIMGITVKLKKDGSGAAGVDGAITDFSNTSAGKVDFHADDKDIVDTITDGLKWTVEIQTRYGTGKPEDDSAYGRGTKQGDKDTGNVSLGFHESCHRNDFFDFFRNNPVPVFGGKTKQSKADVKAAIATYTTAWDEYFEKARANSLTVTDETGDPTMTDYFAS